nr:S26 family signal peptidase [Streptomyces gougerotii]
MIVVAIGIALFLKTFLVQAFVIPSGSMEQTIQVGDRVVVDKLTPYFGSRPSAATSSSSRTPPTGCAVSRPRPPPTTPPSPRRRSGSSPRSVCCPPTTSAT